MSDLISKSDLIEALKDSTTKESKYGDWIYETELIDLINSAPVVSGDNNYKELFLQACRTLSECGRLLEIPEDETTGEPSELFCAIEELKEKSIQTPQPQSARDALEKAARVPEGKAEALCAEHAIYDGETGVWEFGNPNTEDAYNSYMEYADDIRNLIEHDAPSAPIEAEQSGKDEALNMAIEAINMHRARYDNLVNAITNAIEIGNKPLIPSTQAPKESEG